MGQVTIQVAGRFYPLACRDGEERHLERLGEIVDAKAREAVRAMGAMAENRQLLVAALLLADALTDQNVATDSHAAPEDERTAVAIERLADRMESLALTLENIGDHA